MDEGCTPLNRTVPVVPDSPLALPIFIMTLKLGQCKLGYPGILGFHSRPDSTDSPAVLRRHLALSEAGSRGFRSRPHGSKRLDVGTGGSGRGGGCWAGAG